MYNIPMKGDFKKDFVTQIDWPHFHKWLNKAIGNDSSKKKTVVLMNGRNYGVR